MRQDSAGRQGHPAPVDPARHSPPAQRVVRVLELLGAHAGESLTLAETARRAQLSKPTCLGILTTLVEAGFVRRDAAKAYRLGPALVRLGWAAEAGAARLDLIHPHLNALHNRLGHPVMLTGHHDDHVVIVARVGAGLPGPGADRVGERFPSAPPLGLVQYLWQHERALRAWLDRPPYVPLAGAAPLDEVVARARARGYVTERLVDAATTTTTHVIGTLVAAHLPDAVTRRLLAGLPPADWSEYADAPAGEPVRLTAVHAPVFDRQGDQRWTLTLVADGAPVAPHTVRAWANEVTAVARAATADLGAGGGNGGGGNGDGAGRGPVPT